MNMAAVEWTKKEMLFLRLDLQGNYNQSDHTLGYSSFLIKGKHIFDVLFLKTVGSQ